MPQFLEQRYDHNVRMVMAFFWLGVYVFVNLTSILWLGALAMETVAGIDLMYGLVFLVCTAIAVVISVMQTNEDQPGSVDLADIDFSTTRGFNAAGIAVALYATWW